MRRLLARLFGKTSPPAAADPEVARMTTAIRMLCERHGMPARILGGDVVEFPQHGLALRSFVAGVHDSGTSQRSHIEVQVFLGAGATIVECFVGYGHDRASAIDAGLEAFAMSDLHVLRHALFALPPDEQITVEEWTIRGERYSASIGNAVLRGRWPESSVLTSCLSVIEDAVRASDLAGEIHWLRFYHGRFRGETIDLEVLLDNEHWVRVEKSMAALPWPSSDEFYSIRLFLILRRIH